MNDRKDQSKWTRIAFISAVAALVMAGVTTELANAGAVR